MLPYPVPSPYLLETPWFSLHWYGLMYVVAFGLIASLLFYRLRHDRILGLRSHGIAKENLEDGSRLRGLVATQPREAISSLLLWSIVGLAVGARLGYAFLYEPLTFLRDPFLLVWPFARDASGSLALVGLSGFSYHGGLLGIIVALLIWCRRRGVRPFDLADFLIPAIPLGYAFGRLGNFLTGELYGRAASVPWAMVFPTDSFGLPRHPSQLYEAFLEGVFPFLVLWPLRNRRPFRGWTLPAYLVLYGVARFVAEFFREPDPQLGFIFGPFTMGQVLSAGMILAGAGMAVFLIWRTRSRFSPGSSLNATA